MRLVYAMLIAAAAAACATKAGHKQVVESWLGNPEAHLVSSNWGAPHRVYTTGDGTRVLTYSYAPEFSRTRGILICETNFTVEDGVITRVSIRGTCRSR